MTLQNMQFQQETRASIQSLTNQMGQMATQLNQAQSQNSDKLPSQTVQNSKNVSAITLRSGKHIDIPTAVPPPPSALVLVPIPASAPEQNDEPVGARNFHVGGPSSSTNSNLQQPPIPLPFPPKLIPIKKMEEVDKEILETFRKVEVNIPLLDAIKQIPRYAKFLKELCTHKRKIKGNKRIIMGKNVFALIGKSVMHIPEKCKDPGTFCIPCIIGNNKFENAMLDLGVSINVMPLSIFKSLSLGPIQPTGVVIQLANRSVSHPTGFIEDVLVRVGELIFPIDFYVLDMEEGFSHGSVPIILGRPFLKTAWTKTDVYAGTFCLSCIESESEFEYESECETDYEASEFDTLGVVEVQAVEPLLPSLVPSDVQPSPTLELKPLPENLKILLEDGAKPVRQPQRQLNPVILDVVKKEVTKLLQAGIIYPISDSQWVSLV
ncbi:uncharacterized protein LOC109813180 [Cajanus cajan]|uniref:uncharacterized protein LOC109813180 n=1 Tax=Cajanus cajan TaxID=3821 RepID=UPI00098D96C1|nr:uncharacterized protein LOC109813180 [Cajanus cajan]